ncbi:hypothetical protein PABG_04649 [Paracoccidioides brasiliensis Pb03]|nr:hypothetical protein PABG_04649 [Paracoccidioides brasiliensis Pb03]
MRRQLVITLDGRISWIFLDGQRVTYVVASTASRSAPRPAIDKLSLGAITIQESVRWRSTKPKIIHPRSAPLLSICFCRN